jgi:hypothetical protein
MIDGLKLPEAWHAHYLFQLLEEDHIQVDVRFVPGLPPYGMVEFENGGILETLRL